MKGSEELLREFVGYVLETSSHEVVHDRLSGGLADRMHPSEFDPEQLEKGVAHEMEHTDDPDLAREIAMDHLAEDPAYYTHEAFDKGIKRDKAWKKRSTYVPKEDKDEIGDWLDDMGLSAARKKRAKAG